jgi:hypothetical protein
VLERAGYRVERRDLRDAEFSFDGPAKPEIQQGWADRFSRMKGLQSSLGDDFQPFVDEFLRAIGSERHRSLCKVVCCVGTPQPQS